MEAQLAMLFTSLTLLIFIISCSIVGVLMYRLGLNGRITRMMEQADDARKAITSERVEKEPTSMPGSEYNPFDSGYVPRYPVHPSYAEDDQPDEEPEDPRFVTEKDLEEAVFEDDPVIPGPKKRHKVVMTGGYEYSGDN